MISEPQSRMHAPDAPRITHYPALDGLRAIAALFVLWAHIPTWSIPLAINDARTRWIPGWLPGDWPIKADELRHWVHPGYLGVDLFFVLSGFLITRILLEEKQRGTPVLHFIARRSFRIFPIYYLLLLGVGIFAPQRDALYCAAYVSNFVSIDRPFTNFLEHTWSLCVEEHFYLLWPWIVAWLPSRRAIVAFCLIYGVVALSWAALYVQSGAPWIANGMIRSTQFRALSLLMGALLALGERRILRRPRRMACAALILGITSFLLLRHWGAKLMLDPEQRHYLPFVFWVGMALFSTTVLVWVIARGNSKHPLAWFLRSRCMGGIGRISYGLYLYHLPVFAYFGFFGRPEFKPPSGGELLAATGTSLAIATLSYFVIERPLLRYARRFRSPERRTMKA